MSAAVRAVTGYAFATLRLHRIEASCLPHNEASMQLLERSGFTREGYARAYLRINGVWQDHLLYGLLESDPCRSRGAEQQGLAAGRSDRMDELSIRRQTL